MGTEASDVFELTLDNLAAFAQEGWQYPLTDNEATRRAILAWLDERGLLDRPR